MAMTKVTEAEFLENLDKLDSYENEEDMVNGTHLISYFVLGRRVGQEMHNPDDTHHFCIDDQYLERIVKIQEQEYAGTDNN